MIVTHLVNFILMVGIIRAGWQILADHPRLYRKIHCTPDSEWLRFRGPVPTTRVWTAKDDAIMLSPLFGLPGGRHTIGVARHWHFILDILFVINGIVFIVLTFTTQQYLKLVPTQWSILPAAGSCLLQYGALHLPAEPGGYFRFDALQQLSYFFIVFVTAPLAILSGLAMSPALDNRFKWYQRLFGNRQVARSVHFLIMVTFLAFFAVHMIMVVSTHFARNLNAITLDQNKYNLNGVVLTLLAYRGPDRLERLGGALLLDAHARPAEDLEHDRRTGDGPAVRPLRAPGRIPREGHQPVLLAQRAGAHQRRLDAPARTRSSATTASRSTAWSSIRSSCRCRTCASWARATRSRCTTASRDGRRSANGQGCPSPP